MLSYDGSRRQIRKERGRQIEKKRDEHSQQDPNPINNTHDAAPEEEEATAAAAEEEEAAARKAADVIREGAALKDEGTALFKQSKWSAAADKYRQGFEAVPDDIAGCATRDVALWVKQLLMQVPGGCGAAGCLPE